MRTVATVLGVVLGLGVSTARAFDQRDSPSVISNPAADIGDVFAWMSADTQRLNLVMTVLPGATTGSKFSSVVQYVFHVASRATFVSSDADSINVICTFDAGGHVQCWAGSATYVSGDPSGTTGITSADSKLQVFAGLRDDPEFLNLSGLGTMLATIVANLGSFTFDATGCPAISAPTSVALINQLQTGGDFFFAQNTLALVVSVDVSLVTTGGPIVSVWGSTNQG